MNIFYLDSDPTIAAQQMVNSHVVKMILESAQLLSTAHRVADGEMQVVKQNNRNIKRYILQDERDMHLYKATHINHPCAIWVRESVSNYNWLFEHYLELLQEYTYRYEKTHKCATLQGMNWALQTPPFNVRAYDFTSPPNAMDNKYIISDDPIVNYRNYYIFGKSHLHKYKRRNPPEWLITDVEKL